MLTSWKTTIAGLGMFMCAVVLLVGVAFSGRADALIWSIIGPIAAALVSGGAGLLCARDNGVNSEEAGADKKSKDQAARDAAWKATAGK